MSEPGSIAAVAGLDFVGAAATRGTEFRRQHARSTTRRFLDRRDRPVPIGGHLKGAVDLPGIAFDRRVAGRDRIIPLATGTESLDHRLHLPRGNRDPRPVHVTANPVPREVRLAVELYRPVTHTLTPI